MSKTKYNSPFSLFSLVMKCSFQNYYCCIDSPVIAKAISPARKYFFNCSSLCLALILQACSSAKTMLLCLGSDAALPLINASSTKTTVYQWSSLLLLFFQLLCLSSSQITSELECTRTVSMYRHITLKAVNQKIKILCFFYRCNSVFFLKLRYHLPLLSITSAEILKETDTKWLFNGQLSNKEHQANGLWWWQR